MTYAELDLSKKYSYADYLKWTFQERLELIRGKIFKMSPAPSSAHQSVSIRLASRFLFFLEEKGSSCKVFTAPFDVRFPKKKDATAKETFTVLQPDICVICNVTKIDKRGCVGAPDLIVEILSPGNTEREMKDKFDVYEEAGVKEYWIIEPNDKVVLIYVLNDEGKYIGLRPFTQHSVLTSTVLTGFELDLTKIFTE